MQLTMIQKVAIWVLPVLFAITVHEVAHGYVAYLRGDKTAYALGRLTLNPLKHIDILGTIIVPLVLLITGSGVIFGWAKPVPVDSRNLRRPRRDFALISIAGPMANLIMAIIWAGIAKCGVLLVALEFPGALAVYMMGGAGIIFNLVLMVLNLLPIPPLDGGHIIASLLPRSLAFQYERLEPWGFFILLILLSVGVVNVVIQPAVGFLLALINTVFNLSLPL